MKRILISTLTALLSLTAISSVYAANMSCDGDVYEMKAQIQQYDSITSRDGHRFHDVKYPQQESRTQCSAVGYVLYGNKEQYVCRIIWNKGDWGDTFACKS